MGRRCDLERLVWNAKRHKVKKIYKKASRHKIRKYKENGFGSSPAILRFVFCQTARSKENKKTSRHTIRKYIEIYISRSLAQGAEVRCGETRLECQTAQSKENKKASRHKIRKYKENGFGSSPAIFAILIVFCQTARSKENKKTSRHTIRKYIESYEAKQRMRAYTTAKKKRPNQLGYLVGIWI